MCGICGIYNKSFEKPVNRARIEDMNQSLVHRGPDDKGLFIDNNVGLGHRRLSIIDLNSGAQPLFNEDKTIVIVFNGEIYNFKALKAQLSALGHEFQTLTDTECIVHGYEEWGADVVKHLRGMFAFAIWDSQKKQLFLARDRVGIKPLYYYWDNWTFLFASELKAIIQDPEVERVIDPQAIDDFLTYLYIPAPKTIYKKIRKLKPGHTLTISPQGMHEEEYWDISFQIQNGQSEEEMAVSLLEKLRESIDIRLISDVPLGAFLSGGIDSSAVVGIMAGLMDSPVVTSSIGFQEDGFDELYYAKKIAEKYQTRAYEKIVKANAAKILDDLVWHFDEPFADSSMVPTFYVSQVARENVTVCLSGDGGDENFVGYRRYRFDYLENQIRAFLPGFLRRPLFGTLARLYPKADWLPQFLRAKTLFTNLAMSPEQAYINTMSCFTPKMKNELFQSSLKQSLDDYDSQSVMMTHFERTKEWDPISRIQYVDMKTYLADDILTKVDRASMAHSLEVRVPILDHVFMEYSASIPAKYKLKDGNGKYIFKKALESIVPHENLHRAKMGFSIPLADWLRQDLKKVFEDRVFSENSFVSDFFHMNVIKQWWAQHQRKTRDYSTYLWAILMLECWGEKFVKGK